MIKALLYKDIVNLKKFMRTMLLMALVIAVLFRSQGSSLMIMIYAATLLLTTLTLDEKEHFLKRAISDKGRQKALLLEKYVLLFVVLAAAAVLSIILEIVMAAIFKYETDSTTLVFTIFGGLTIAVFSTCVTIPLTIRYGTEKARILMLACYLVPAVLIIWLMPKLEGLQVNTLTLALLLLGSIAIMIGASMTISMKLFKKKDY